MPSVYQAGPEGSQRLARAAAATSLSASARQPASLSPSPFLRKTSDACSLFLPPWSDKSARSRAMSAQTVPLSILPLGLTPQFGLEYLVCPGAQVEISVLTPLTLTH